MQGCSCFFVTYWYILVTLLTAFPPNLHAYVLLGWSLVNTRGVDAASHARQTQAILFSIVYTAQKVLDKRYWASIIYSSELRRIWHHIKVPFPIVVSTKYINQRAVRSAYHAGLRRWPINADCEFWGHTRKVCRSLEKIRVVIRRNSSSLCRSWSAQYSCRLESIGKVKSGQRRNESSKPCHNSSTTRSGKAAFFERLLYETGIKASCADNFSLR